MKKIIVKELPLIPNICRQDLREVYKNKDASLAHVIMPKDNVSLLHNHTTFTEWYYILRGVGIMEAGDGTFEVSGGQVIILSPGEKHKITNTGEGTLEHLVFSTPPFNPNDVHILEEIPDE